MVDSKGIIPTGVEQHLHENRILHALEATDLRS